MIESILRAAACRTGLYTSPHLHTVRERMRVDGEPISRESLAALVDEVEPHVAGIEGITWFEIVTVLGCISPVGDRRLSDRSRVGQPLTRRTPSPARVGHHVLERPHGLVGRHARADRIREGGHYRRARRSSVRQEPEALAVLERIAARDARR
jgi:hypothetical protein